MRSSARGGAWESPGTSETVRDVARLLDGHLTRHRAAGRLGLEHDQLARRREHVAVGTEQDARLAHTREKVTGGVDQPGQDQVSQGVAGQLALVVAVPERDGQGGVLVGQGHQALADVAEGHHVEQFAQASAAAAVVGHRHDAGQGAGVATRCPERDGRAVPAADGDDRGAGAHRSTSRWKTDTDSSCAPSRAASSSARVTERCRPPVHPMAMVR